EIQKEEREKFQNIVLAEIRSRENDFDISGIIFQVLEKDKFVDPQTSYDWAMKEIRLNSHYLSPMLKQTFIFVLEKVAKAFPPVTREEKNFLDRFMEDISSIEGDPVFYKKN
ncbi:MAG: hypothetical protein H0X46_03250, partial [Bacteroidetes bacterium]|nr:hypothetical protein [Bacteroidota bacterium]